MPRCCGSAGSCACKIEGGRNITVTGVGSSQDPVVIAADVALGIEDNKTFDITLTGNGRLESPWMLSVDYASTASIDHLPDVDVAGAINGNVLAYSTATKKWEAAPPTTAAAGGMTTDLSLDGDGSVGDPLMVRPNAARYLMVDPDGLGLTNEALNRMLRFFPDAPTRASLLAARGTESAQTANRRSEAVRKDPTDGLAARVPGPAASHSGPREDARPGEERQES